MTQQTHPGQTDGPSEEHPATPQQGESREPLWYDGPAAWHSPSGGSTPPDAASAAGETTALPTSTPDSAPQGASPQGDFGLTSQAAPTSGAAPTTSVPTTSFGWATETAETPIPAAFGGPSSGSGDRGTPGTPSGAGWGGGDGGWGGPYTGAPVTTAPAPEPKPRRGRRFLELTTVAVLAAALAGGGSYAAVKATTPSTTTTTSGSAPATGNNPPAPVAQGSASAPDWTATAKAVSPSVVSITVQSSSAEGQGSGVVIDAGQGYVLTNNHVATGAGAGAKIAVTLSDGRSYDATIKGTDPSTDLAVLKITSPPNDLKAISIGDSSSLVVGQPVMAVGNPLGLAGTVTTGIVSALNRPVTTEAADSGTDSQDPLGGQGQSSGTPVTTNAIQTSAAINPGNSGGALVTANGQLIGINSSIASLGGSSGGSQSGNIGIGFAIPSKEAKSIADQLIATGKAEHAYLGVSAADTTVTDGNSKRAAALIRTLSSGTPAASAGLKQGDAIVAIDGQSIDSKESLVATIHEYNVGEKVTVTVIRSGQKQDIPVTLAARPAQG